MVWFVIFFVKGVDFVKDDKPDRPRVILSAHRAGAPVEPLHAVALGGLVSPVPALLDFLVS